MNATVNPTATVAPAPVNITENLNRISSLKAELAQMEANVAAARVERLKNLHVEVGCADTISLIKELRNVMAGQNPNAPRTRGVVTDETKKKVREMVKGGKTGQQIAEALGISIPTVQNIKKDLGLVNSRTPAPTASTKK